MIPALGSNSYGKSAIRLVTVTRHGTRHDLRDLTVDIALEGDFDAAHMAGDNRAVLPTDTMKNTVYALAKAHVDHSPEAFAAVIGHRLLEACGAARAATVSIVVHGWDRARIDGTEHDHAFTRGVSPSLAGSVRRLASVRVARDSVTLSAGIAGLGLLKSADSGFAGFLRDEYTTLRETDDRILATDLDAEWRYALMPESFDAAWTAVQGALVRSFAQHDSRSVQHTMYAMGTAALAQCPQMEEIHLRMPNKHHLLVDLSAYGQTNANEVFVATEAPYGLIGATVRRG